MSMLEAGPLAAMVVLGGLHGINPAMGWLFAVALGLQERNGRAVWRALPPLAVGHALSVALVVAVAVLIGRMLPAGALRVTLAVVLAGVGVHRLMRGHRHPRLGGMQVSQRELVLWSFLMATAHGAGLMLLPFVAAPEAGAELALHGAHSHATSHTLHAAMIDGQLRGLFAALVHTASYLGTAALLAYLVYARLGVRILRSAWINLDLVWSGALILTAALTLVPLLRG